MEFLKNFMNVFKKKKVMHIDLDPESVREHNIIRSLANENAELKTKLAKLIAKQGEERERKRDIKEEEYVKEELERQRKEIERNKYPKYFSLKSFFKKYFQDKKFQRRIGFYTWDGESKIDNFGDIGLGFDGNIYLLNPKGNVIMYGRTIYDIFRRIPSLKNDLKAGMIPLNLDKDLGYVENIMVWEAPELIPHEEGGFVYAKARKKPLYEYLKELREQIAEQQEEIEKLEIINNKLQQENDRLKIAARVAGDRAEVLSRELGETENEVISIKRIFKDLEKELTQLRETNNVLEENIDKLEKQLTIMRDKAEREEVKTSFEDALEKIQNIRRELVRDEPKLSQIKISQGEGK